MGSGDPNDTTLVSGSGAPAIAQHTQAALGRYLLLHTLGSGAMGVVHAAYDPQLDRRVALKLVKSNTWLEGSEGRARLLKEARAMAALAHPNVVAVHDAGSTADGDVYVAMELIDGPTLSAWLAQTKRGWREVLEAYLQAGRGLAAAHAAGLVHRDFKPENVLVDREGRVRVTDFGVAHVSSAAPAAPSLGGTMVGTPRYMSPEAFAGRAYDARSDQFSFCVALYHSLFGQFPFEADSYEALAFAVSEGKRRPAPASPVPAAVVRALEKGLSVEPEKRHPSMEALLTVLREALRPTRVWSVAAGAALVLIAAGAYGLTLRSPCTGAAAHVAKVWNAEQKQRMRAAMLATGLPYAEDAFQGSARALDDYAAAWVRMHTETCEATRVHGEQSEAALQLRMNCLDRKLTELGAVVSVLAAADAVSTEKAVAAAHALGSLEGCADLAALGAVTAPPDKSRVAEIVAATQKVADAKALKDAGRYPDGAKRAQEAVEAAKAASYPPVLAEALFQLADLKGRGGDPKTAEAMLYDAAQAAELGRHDELRAQAWTELVWYVGSRQGRHADGERAAAMAEAIISRLGDRPQLKGRLLNYRGVVLRALGRFDEAKAVLEQAFTLLSRALPKGHPDLASPLTNLGLVAWQRGDTDTAIDRHRQALAINEAALGANHPAVAGNLNNLSIVYLDLGRFPESIELGQRALEIREAALGKEHVQLASTFTNLSEALWKKGDLARAHAYADRAIALREKAGPHPDLSAMYCTLGDVQRLEGDLAGAAASFARAGEIVSKQGPEHPQWVTVKRGDGEVKLAKGDAAGAKGLFEEALALQSKTRGTEQIEFAQLQLDLGRASLALGHPLDAVEPLQRGLERCAKRSVDPTLKGELELELARAFAKTDAARAKSLASDAKRDCAVYPRGAACASAAAQLEQGQ